MCQEQPLRGRLRVRRVPEECPAVVDALIDACIESEASAARPSAYEAFVCLACRYEPCGRQEDLTKVGALLRCSACVLSACASSVGTGDCMCSSASVLCRISSGLPGAQENTVLLPQLQSACSDGCMSPNPA